MQNCSPRLDRDLRCPKRKAPAGAGGLGGLGLLIFETKTHPVTAGIMIEERIGSLPYELNWIACIPLLLLLFGKAGCGLSVNLSSSRSATVFHVLARMNRSILALFIAPLGYRLCVLS